VNVLVGAGSSNHEKMTVTLGQGSCIGEMAWITKRPRVATVQARTAGHAYKIAGEHIREIASKQHDNQLIADLCEISGKRLAEQFLLQDPVFDSWARRDISGYLSKWKKIPPAIDDYCLTSKLPIMLVHGSCYLLDGEALDVAKLKAEGEQVSTAQHGPRMLQTKNCSFKGTLSGGSQFTCLVSKGSHLLTPPPQPPVAKRQRHKVGMTPMVKGSDSEKMPEQAPATEEHEKEEEDATCEEDPDGDEDHEHDAESEDDEDDEDDEEGEDHYHPHDTVLDGVLSGGGVSGAYQKLHQPTNKTLTSRVRFTADVKSTKPKQSRRTTRYTASAMEFYLSAAQPAHQMPTGKLMEESQQQAKMGASRVTLSNTTTVKRSSILPALPAGGLA